MGQCAHYRRHPMGRVGIRPSHLLCSASMHRRGSCTATQSRQDIGPVERINPRRDSARQENGPRAVAWGSWPRPGRPPDRRPLQDGAAGSSTGKCRAGTAARERGRSSPPMLPLARTGHTRAAPGGRRALPATIGPEEKPGGMLAGGFRRRWRSITARTNQAHVLAKSALVRPVSM